MAIECYRIVDWATHYENNRTRELRSLTWFPISNRQDGDGYTEMLDHENGPAHYGAWVALVAVASKCDPRGTLLRDAARAHDSSTLARITRFPKSIIEGMIPRALSVGWLERISIDGKEVASIPQDDATAPHEGAPRVRAQKGREGKGTEGNGMEDSLSTGADDPDLISLERDFISAWNGADGCRHNRGDSLTPARRKAFRTRLKSKGWEWQAALAKFPLKCTEQENGWKPDLEWFLRPDSVHAILEGKYDWTPKQTGTPAPKNGSGQVYDPTAAQRNPNHGKW